MDPVAEILRLLNSFGALCPEAVVEPGPLHPETRPELNRLLAQWLARFPQLFADPGYIAFLQHCSSACAFSEIENVQIELVGVLQFEEEVSGFMPPPEGWYCLGWSSVYRDKIGDINRQDHYGFSFDLFGRGPWGVHCEAWRGGQEQSPPRRIADNFTEFLQRLIDTRGDLEATT